MHAALFLTLLSATAGAEPAAATAARPDRDRPVVRARIGILGGLSMQKTDLLLGASYDPSMAGFGRMAPTADLVLGLRPKEFTLEPMVGLRYTHRTQATKFDATAAALAGLNLTFMRGTTAVALALRLGGGVTYWATPRFGFAMDLALEFGPGLVPYVYPVAAIHATLGVVHPLGD